jgi:hypothetical protein
MKAGDPIDHWLFWLIFAFIVSVAGLVVLSLAR